MSNVPSLVVFLIMIISPAPTSDPPLAASGETTYPDTPASAGLSCAGVLPLPNILLIVANEGLLITGAM